MKKFWAALVFLLVLFMGSSRYDWYPKELRTDLSGIELYQTFISSLDSVELTRSERNYSSWYETFAYTQEEIRIQNIKSLSPQFTYCARQPSVFWSHPRPDYFDGTNYYYEHNGKWVHDVTNRFVKYKNADFLGIPAYIFRTYPLVSDEVYQVGPNYEVHLLYQSEDQKETFEIIGYLNSEQEFTKILISRYRLVDQEKQVVRDYEIEYSSYNEPLDIKDPRK